MMQANGVLEITYIGLYTLFVFLILCNLLLIFIPSKFLEKFFKEPKRDDLKDYYNLTDEEFDTIFIKED